MPDREKIIEEMSLLRDFLMGEERKAFKGNNDSAVKVLMHYRNIVIDSLALLKQETKQITLHKKHVITWKRDDEFTMRKLYEAVCETLMDEGELFIARTDDHEKVNFVFYVADGR